MRAWGLAADSISNQTAIFGIKDHVHMNVFHKECFEISACKFYIL